MGMSDMDRALREAQDYYNYAVRKNFGESLRSPFTFALTGLVGLLVIGHDEQNLEYQ